jgi:ComF family protein
LLVDLLGDAADALPLIAPLHAVVPVPLHPRRRRERGFDQAELLARPLAQAVGIPLRSGLLVRTRHTPPQIRRTPHERRENVRGAFALGYPLPVPQARLLLVDDVYTTGATLGECARTLRRGGAGEIYAVTLSRAAPDWMPVRPG